MAEEVWYDFPTQKLTSYFMKPIPFERVLKLICQKNTPMEC